MLQAGVRAAALRTRGSPTRQALFSYMRAFSTASAGAGTKIPIAGIPREALRAELATHFDIKPAASDAIFSAVHREGLQSWDACSAVGSTKAAALHQRYTLATPRVLEHQVSGDGTQKWLLQLADGASVETVFIPETAAPKPGGTGGRKVDRGVLCVSSQVGCSLSCSFCHTGTQPLRRNLAAADIVGQLRAARLSLGDYPLPHGQATVSNIVFMGQGEPLYNWRNVSAATRVFTDRRGGAIPHKRCTISTSGVAPRMAAVGRDLGINLALSLHATTDDVRSRIMGINRSYPLATVLQACREFRDSKGGEGDATPASLAARRAALRGEAPPAPTGPRRGRRILFEYILLEGVNDSEQDARRLVDMVGEFNCHVNVSPFNPWPGAPYACPADEAVLAFGKVLLEAGVTTSIRWPRGRDIMAACGQLHSAHEGGDAAAAGLGAALEGGASSTLRS